MKRMFDMKIIVSLAILIQILPTNALLPITTPSNYKFTNMLAQNINILASGDAQLLALFNEYLTENPTEITTLFSSTSAITGTLTLNLSPTQWNGAMCNIAATSLQPVSGGTGYTTIKAEPFADIYGTLKSILLASGGAVKVCLQSRSTTGTDRADLNTFLTTAETTLVTNIIAYLNTLNVLQSTVPYSNGNTAYTASTPTFSYTSLTVVADAISSVNAGTCDIALGVQYTSSIDQYRISCPYAFVPTDGTTAVTAPTSETTGSYLVMLVKADPQLNTFQNPATTATSTTPAVASSALFSITAYSQTAFTALTAWTGTLAFKFRYDLATNLSIPEYRVMFSSNPSIYTFGSTAVTFNGASSWGGLTFFPYSFPIEISNTNSTGQVSVVNTIGTINVGVSTGRLLSQTATKSQPSGTAYIVFDTTAGAVYNVKAVGVNFQYGPGSAAVAATPFYSLVLLTCAVFSALYFL